MSSLLQKDPEAQSGGGAGSTARERSAPTPPSQTKGRGKAFAIFFVVLAVLAIGGTLYWMHERQFESTDDAEVDGHLNTISPRVEGTIFKVYVDDNQVVKAGDPLVDFDPRDYQVAVDQAQAQLAQAQSMVSASNRTFRLRWCKTALIFQAARRTWQMRRRRWQRPNAMWKRLKHEYRRRKRTMIRRSLIWNATRR